jgi:sugar lactone lactonase YvrE
MYFIDSPTRRVDALAFDPDRGEATDRTTFVDTSAFPGLPDGLAIDAEGCLWIAMHEGAAVRRFSPEGRHVGTVAMPVARTTSCCFAGPDLDRLVVTTARGADGAGGDLFVVDPGVVGTPTVAFAG